MTDWDEIYARLITATGWTWEYLDEFMTLPRLNALNKHWGQFPPVHMSVAAFTGVEMKAPGTPKKAEDLAAQVAKSMTADPRKLTWKAAP